MIGDVQADCDQQRHKVERLGVEGRDHDERDDVVDDDDREHERAQAIGEPRPDEREQAERERGVGRHRDSPALCGRAPAVEREVDRDCDGHAADRGQRREREASAFPQLAEIELAPCLEPEDEEEERHQAAVDPLAQIERHAVSAEVDRERRPPKRVVGRLVDVDPDERGDRRSEQDGRTAGLGAKKLP